jgi:biopolymer transport protein ExbD
LRRKNRKKVEDSALDLTPMMDIVFIMLIFFIVTTSFVKETGVDKRRVDLKAVRANIERLKIEYPGGSVIIQADKESRSGLLVEAMDQIRLAGVQNISIAAKNDN